jgi:hypothetical protein
MAEVFKTFAEEWWVIIALILFIIPFNPTNIFVDVILQPLISDFLSTFRVFAASIYLPWLIKGVLAVAETDVLLKWWKIFVK